jgi:PAS domain S-box-containing protein
VAEIPDNLSAPKIERYLLDQAPVAVVGVDPEGVVTHWNRQAEVLFGWQAHQVLGQTLGSFIEHPSWRQVFESGLHHVLTGESWEGEIPIPHADGPPLVAHLSVAPARDQGGRIIGVTAVFVDVTELDRAERRAEAGYELTRILAESASLEDATPKILQTVAQSLGWEMGAIWEVDQATRVLRCANVWTSLDAPSEEFEETTRGRTFDPGVGLPGRVWESGEPAWITDVTVDPNFPRAAVAAREGIHGAFAFPIRLGQEVLGVLEFFSREVREPDPDLLQMMSAVGSQIGQFIERTEAQEAVRRSEVRKTAILESALDCIITMDHLGKVVEFNPAAEETFGYRRDEVVGKRLAELIIPPPLREAHRQGLARYLATGEGPVLGKRLELVGMRADGTEFPVELAITPISVGGQPMFSGHIRDITHRKRREEERSRLLELEQQARAESEAASERLAFLAEASAILAGSLDYRKTLAKVARLVVPKLADWCSVDVVEGEEIRQVVVAHVDPQKTAWARDFRERYPLDPEATTGVPGVIRTGRPELYEEISDDMLRDAAKDDEQLEFVRKLGFRSAMAVPLTARGRTFGAITFVAAESERRYGPADLAFAEDIAHRAAQAVDNARLFQERAHVARTLQQSLLPRRLPEIPGVQIAARYNPAGEGNEVGGDFYDVFEADGAWMLVMGDVQGKGAEAAAVTGLARYTIRTVGLREQEPSRILRILNEALMKEETNRFCTVACARLQISDGRPVLIVSCGGHPPPIVLKADGTAATADCRGDLIGIWPDVDVMDRRVELGPGDLLLFYTDGVVEEHRAHEPFGEERLLEILRSCVGLSAENVAEKVERTVLEIRSESPRDDMALLVLRVAS